MVFDLSSSIASQTSAPTITLEVDFDVPVGTTTFLALKKMYVIRQYSLNFKVSSSRFIDYDPNNQVSNLNTPLAVSGAGSIYDSVFTDYLTACPVHTSPYSGQDADIYLNIEIDDGSNSPIVLVTSIFVLLGQDNLELVNLFASIYLWNWDSATNQWSEQPYEPDVPTD